MATRAATDTIKGYFYQFDYSILEILKLKEITDSATIEGVEDIDLSTATEESAIQCKYYAKSEYNHSVIAEPIRLMLNHFASHLKSGTQKYNYILRGHYKSGHSKLVLPIDLQMLKDKFLTYHKTVDKQRVKIEHHLKLSLNDTQLEEFLKQLTVDINAADFETQFNEVIKLLMRQFNSSQFIAEHFYYNNALRLIKELSIDGDERNRTIQKKEFLEKIDTSSILFNEWFILKKGKDAYFKNLKKEYFTQLNISPFERFFILEVNPESYERNKLKSLLFIIERKWAKTSKREPKPFCPYIYIHNIDSDELIELKKELYAEDFIFIDGYDFNGASFNPSSIIKEANFTNKVRLKIINEAHNIDEILKATGKTKEIYQFYLNKPFYEQSSSAIKHIKIQVEEFTNIKDIV